MKKMKYMILYITAIILIILFGVFLNVDWLNYYEYMSAPFYIYIVIRGLEFIVPSIFCIVLATIIKKKKK